MGKRRNDKHNQDAGDKAPHGDLLSRFDDVSRLGVLSLVAPAIYMGIVAVKSRMSRILNHTLRATHRTLITVFKRGRLSISERA